MKKKHILFFITETVCIIALLLLAAISIKNEYTPLFLMAILGIAVCSLFIGYYKGSIPKTQRPTAHPEKKARRRGAFGIVLSLILLANQSIGIVDLLPDFISYLIIASTLSYAAYKAPGFDDAKVAFLKLALINALKFPALIILAGSRTVNATGNDLTTVMSLSFAVVEFIFLISAIKHLFDALFRLGERTDASSLIKPIRVLGFRMPAELLKSVTMAFAVTRCIFEFLPDLFLLTGTAGDGFTIVTVRAGYPIFTALGQLIGNLFGVIWLVLMLKYLKGVKKEGRFYSALDSIEKTFSPVGAKTRKFVAKLKLGLTFLTLAALLSIELKFSNLLEINILPHAIQGIFFLVAVRLIGDAVGKKQRKRLTTLAITHIAVSLIAYTAEVYFMYEFGYRALLKDANNTVARLTYSVYECAGIIECAVFVIFFIALARALKKIILDHTAIPPSHERYSRTDSDYHKAFIKRSNLLCISGIIMALSRCANIFAQSYIDTFFTTQPVITLIPSIPWFGLFVFVTAAAFGGLSLYFTSILKEDVEMKYIEQ